MLGRDCGLAEILLAFRYIPAGSPDVSASPTHTPSATPSPLPVRPQSYAPWSSTPLYPGAPTSAASAPLYPGAPAASPFQPVASAGYYAYSSPYVYASAPVQPAVPLPVSPPGFASRPTYSGFAPGHYAPMVATQPLCLTFCFCSIRCHPSLHRLLVQSTRSRRSIEVLLLMLFTRVF